jgi:Bacterial Ig-like domain (group 1)
MRRFLQIAFFSVAAAACGSSNPASTGDGTGGNNNATAYSLSADSTFLDRTAPIGTALATTVHVELGGQAAANVAVSWFTSVGSGTTSAKTSTTDANGNASITWTLSDTARVNTLTATAGTGSVNLTATSTPGAPTAIAPATADSTSLVAGASTLISVRIVDSFGNRVSGIPVSWTATGGSLSTQSSTTGSAGNADVVFMTAATPASYSITATAPGLSPVSFKVIGF